MIRMIQIKCLFVLFLLLSISGFSFSQNPETTKEPTNFKTFVSVTNNGISLIPTFSLGEPAIIFEASIGRRLTFDPMIRYSLEGKPWSYIFWWRYKLIKPNKLQMTLGAHPSIMFRTVNGTINGVST